MKHVTERIYDFNAGRIPAMLNYKYHYMTKNLFRFYRATCHLFYEDLVQDNHLPNSPLGWICGDMHLENFGSYKGSNGMVYFDLNDFDEAVLAPVAWEAVRLVTSILVAFESLKIDNDKAMHMANLFLKSYAATLGKGKACYIEASTARGIIKEFLETVGIRKQKSILAERTEKGKILLEHAKHLQLDRLSKKELLEHVGNWLKNDDGSPYNYEAVDAAFRLAGTSSLGINRYEILLKSTNGNGKRYLLLDMKQAMPSSLTSYLPNKQPKFANEGERIVFLQQLLQNQTPALLSSTIYKGIPFIMHEMEPVKDSINFKLIKKNYRGMCEVIDSMGMLAASSQLRAAGRKGAANADALVKFGLDCNWQESILNYSLKAAAKTKKYFEAFKKDQEKIPLLND